ncbi:hypothetical protein ABEX47_07025 [Paenibacillus ehimensis]|nr:hypothetical protein [Paenibacillus ehimensis]
MKDWVLLLTAIIQLVTAIIALNNDRKTNKKGTKKRRRPGKRK